MNIGDDRLKEKQFVLAAATLPGFGHCQQKQHGLQLGTVGRSRTPCPQPELFGPSGCKLDASRDIPFPASSARATRLIALPIPGRGERHTVSKLPFLQAQTELEHCVKPWDGNHQGKGPCAVTSVSLLGSCSGSLVRRNVKFRATLLSRNSCVSVTSMNYG